jgi:HK97 family phage prohead protease
MQTIVRSVLTTSTKRLDSKTRVITFVGTKESPDRTGDIIRVGGWEFDNFQKNPVFLWNHDPSIPPIGKILKIQTIGKEVHFDVKFAPASVNEFADTVFKLFSEGFLSAVSVGFIVKDLEPIFSNDGNLVGLDIIRQELLELSAVAIPAHQDALAASAYGAKYDAFCDEYEKNMIDAEKMSKAVSLDEYRKSLPPFTEEVDEIMKEEFEALKLKVEELEKTLESVISLRESVDLSVKTMETLNKSVVALFEKEVPQTPAIDPAAVLGGSTPNSTLNLEKLMGALGTALTKIEKSAKFKVQGEQ